MSKVKGIFIYSDYPSSSLLINEITGYIGGYGFIVQNRGNFFEFLSLTEQGISDLARRITATKVSDISAPLDEIYEPSYREADSELKRINGKESYINILYDGLWLQRVFYNAMSRKTADDLGSGFAHIIFTGRLFGTFETKRYHARVILTGVPSLISTSGIVEAPARPREYYWLKAGLIRGGEELGELDLLYKGKFIQYDDPRISEVLKAYVLQAIFYEITGTPFCDNPSCRLYNSHWQEEVLKTQFEGRLCHEHESLISSIK